MNPTVTARAAVHAALSTPDRVAIMDYLATVPDASGYTISKHLKRSQTWISTCLTKLQKAGLIVRKATHADAFNADIRNSVAPGVAWPINAPHAILSNPDRVAIMDYLAEQREASVMDVALRIKRTQTHTTQHLTKMRAAGLVTSRRDKQTVYNRIADGVVWPIEVWK